MMNSKNIYSILLNQRHFRPTVFSRYGLFPVSWQRYYLYRRQLSVRLRTHRTMGPKVGGKMACKLTNKKQQQQQLTEAWKRNKSSDTD